MTTTGPRWQKPGQPVGLRSIFSSRLRATLGDLVLTGIAWLGTALVTWNRDWALQRWTPRVWLSLLGLALVLSVSVELHAQAMGWWVYTERTPLLPLTPVSVLPVLQLALLFPLSFGLARAIALRTAHARIVKRAFSWNG